MSVINTIIPKRFKKVMLKSQERKWNEIKEMVEKHEMFLNVTSFGAILYHGEKILEEISFDLEKSQKSLFCPGNRHMHKLFLLLDNYFKTNDIN